MSEKCPRVRGWKCIIDHEYNSYFRDPDEPCGLVPRWWNIVDLWRFRKWL